MCLPPASAGKTREVNVRPRLVVTQAAGPHYARLRTMIRVSAILRCNRGRKPRRSLNKYFVRDPVSPRMYIKNPRLNIRYNSDTTLARIGSSITERMIVGRCHPFERLSQKGRVRISILVPGKNVPSASRFIYMIKRIRASGKS